MKNLMDWNKCERPGQHVLLGAYVQLEPFDKTDHGAGLACAIAGPENIDLWHYMPVGPFEGAEDLTVTLEKARAHAGWETMVIRARQSHEILGMASYMRIREEHGSAEVGCVTFGHKLQRTRAATEAMVLMADHVFTGLGYRRYEWKCNSANEASVRAAKRLGFTYEGIFRQDMVVKGQNRDTAWFSILDHEWPLLAAGFKRWLEPANFEENGQQRCRLEACLRQA